MIACIKWIGAFAQKTTKPNPEKSQPALNPQPERSYSNEEPKIFMSEPEKPTQSRSLLKGFLKRIWLVVTGIVLVAVVLLWPLISNHPVDYSDIEDHFKYGSIGSEPVTGIP